MTFNSVYHNQISSTRKQFSPPPPPQKTINYILIAVEFEQGRKPIRKGFIQVGSGQPKYQLVYTFRSVEEMLLQVSLPFRQYSKKLPRMPPSPILWHSKQETTLPRQMCMTLSIITFRRYCKTLLFKTTITLTSSELVSSVFSYFWLL